MNCVIVDDDELDRLMVIACLRKHPEIKILEVFSSSIDALLYLESHPVDILFLDIDMPEMSGIELRKQLPPSSICIFITSYPEHAVESFDVGVLDFMVKPIKADRFKQTITRIKDYMEIREKVSLFEASLGGDSILIKEGHSQSRIKLHSILYLQALKDYTLIFTTEKRHCVLISLGNILKEKEFQNMTRVHRSFAINQLYIEKLTTHEVFMKNEHIIPLGRGYKESLKHLWE
ncbi:MAG: LytTR family DNA-binding domain-containing protein [Bacteroidota bacterium]